MNERRRVNILMVDDQPAKLLSYEAILNELGENLIKAHSGQRSPGPVTEERYRCGSDGRQHARTRRLRTRRYDSAASTLSENSDYLYFRRALDGSEIV